ncbi:MAG: fumarylacetoacetase [Ignavibacteria bacterium]
MKMESFVNVNPKSDFPIENIPFGVYKNTDDNIGHICTTIGDYIVDLKILEEQGFFFDLGNEKVFDEEYLNKFMAKGRKVWQIYRRRIQELLGVGNKSLGFNKELLKKVLIPRTKVQMCMPVIIGDYTDFYSSLEHASNVGSMFRSKDNPLLPNWFHLPVAYHGRASSIVISGTNINRPKGQIVEEPLTTPIFSPTRKLDFELEMGFFIGPGNALGEHISINQAVEHIFGMVIVNDWSARDIQKWEYVPLGPFLAKNFATSISPWIVTMDALEPFRVQQPVPKNPLLDYLRIEGANAFDINLEVSILTSQLNEPFTLTRSNFKYLYWNIYQQVAHHTINGCNLRTGDLLASGTISGKDKMSFGSLLELTWNGEKPIILPSGERRVFLEDGDEIIMKAYCESERYRIGFGEVRGKIVNN